MSSAQTVRPLLATTPNPSTALPALPERLPWRSSVLSGAAIAVLVILILGSVYLVYRQPGVDGGGEAPAMFSGAVAERDVPRPEECTVAAITPQQMASRGPTSSTTVLPIMPMVAAGATFGSYGMAVGERPRGEDADSETEAGVTATIRELTACLNDQDIGRHSALFSDDYWRRNNPDRSFDPAFNWLPVLDPNQYPSLPSERMKAMPLVADVQRMADGRVSALVVHPDDGTTVARVQLMTLLTDDRLVARVGLLDPLDLVIFSWAGDRWLVDEAAPITDVKAIALTYAAGALTPPGTELLAGDSLVVVVRNDDETEVTLGIQDIGNSETLELSLLPGETGHLLLADPEWTRYPILLVDVEAPGSGLPREIGSIHATSPTNSALGGTVRLLDNGIVPDQVRIPAETKITLWFENQTATTRVIKNNALALSIEIEPGQRRAVTINAAAGTAYELRYLSADGRGPEGILPVVVE